MVCDRSCFVLSDETQSTISARHVMVPGFLFKDMTEWDIFRSLNLFEDSMASSISKDKKMLVKAIVSKLTDVTEKASQSFTFSLNTKASSLVLDISYVSHIRWAESLLKRLFHRVAYEDEVQRRLLYKYAGSLSIDLEQQKGNSLYYWVTVSVLLTTL